MPFCQIHCSDGWDRTAQAPPVCGEALQKSQIFTQVPNLSDEFRWTDQESLSRCVWTKLRHVGATWQFVLGLTPRAEAPPSTPAESTLHVEFVGSTTWHTSRTGTEALSVLVHRLHFTKSLCISQHTVQPHVHFIGTSRCKRFITHQDSCTHCHTLFSPVP